MPLVPASWEHPPVPMSQDTAAPPFLPHRSSLPARIPSRLNALPPSRRNPFRSLPQRHPHHLSERLLLGRHRSSWLPCSTNPSQRGSTSTTPAQATQDPFHAAPCASQRRYWCPLSHLLPRRGEGPSLRPPAHEHSHERTRTLNPLPIG
ncbi:hypothetical protein EI42_06100 [Thermosporothrix hazakensis]|uniref:Uncharacterized protein n=1 Tax=Thermosporothrix hazakensis TaxID=644383 RepID=A0A326TRM6_THEHA|nr:hypothetical protein EI42_06100 [Thermosporothrix hazakensis]